MQLKDNDQLPISIQTQDEFGNPCPAVFDAAPAWSSSDDSVAKVVASDDGLSAVVSSPAGKLADAMIQVTASVGGKPLQGELPITIVPGDTASITLAPGTPTAV